MLQTLIIDDEKYVITSLSLSIPWNELNLLPPLTASSAEEALSILETNTVHIIITDIQMPGLSGIELTKQLYNQNSNLQIIVISGHADFQYAQSAIRYGVLGYCLKPINQDELIHYIKIACMKYQNTANIPTNFIELLEKDNAELLYNILLDASIDPECFYLATSINLGDLSSEIGAKLSYKLGTSRYVYMSSISFECSRENLSDISAKQGGFGYSFHTINIDYIARSIRDCNLKAAQYFIKGTTLFCHTLPSEKYFKELTQLTAYLSNDNQSNILELLNRFKDTTHLECNISFALRLYNLVFSSTLFSAISDSMYYVEYEEILNDYPTFLSMLDDIILMLQQKNADANEGTSACSIKSNTAFLMIMKYINDHFTENISLQSISDELHMNPNYISQLFKKGANTTYIKYLNNLRINHAKKLLETTDATINEICDLSGFNDYFYFIKTFKKIVGTSPTKYRMEYLNEFI